MKTQAKLIAVIAVVAISTGVAFGMLQRPQVAQAQFVALSDVIELAPADPA
jgi:type IV secretory pathway VirB2 component (pilin)